MLCPLEEVLHHLPQQAQYLTILYCAKQKYDCSEQPVDRQRRVIRVDCVIICLILSGLRHALLDISEIK